MKKHFLNSATLAFVFLLPLSQFSCDASGGSKATGIPVGSTPSVTNNDTSMPEEPATAAVSVTDSLTPSAKAEDEPDSIGSKISIHKGKVKVVDTTKKDN